MRASTFVCLALLVLGSLSQQSHAQQQAPGLGPAGALQSIHFEKDAATNLVGVDARLQLLVSGKYASGQVHDLTHQVAYSVEPAGIVQLEEGGFLKPLADGEVTVTARHAGGLSDSLTLTVQDVDQARPINFSNQIVPVFTKLGCNAGGCHGKSDGQNGFKLSLLGFYPEEDYEFLVKQDRGRRIFPAAPEYSLLLTKPAGMLPHGGGLRLEEGSYEWGLLTRWIQQGQPYGSEEDPVVSNIEVFPAIRSMNRGADQQLAVIAHYSDGSRQDVTRLATYESNDGEMAETTRSGVVKTLDTPGEAAIMIRFQGQVTVFRASIPLGVQFTAPQPRNVVDETVFAKLTALGIPPSAVCDDATYIRRVTIDIAGRLPRAEEVEAFLADTDPAKRDKLVDRLLDSPGYGDYFANKWANVLRNKRVGNNQALTFRFHNWIRRSLQQNLPYDQFVRNILAASGDPETHPPVAWYQQVTTQFDRVEDTAQLFLGLRIQCARCHHHPFERWSQDDYYGLAAFFSQIGTKEARKGGANARVFHTGKEASAQNPRSGENLKPSGLAAEPLEIPAYEDPRQYLVDWMTQPDNPFFARSLVNRYWKHFFGRGIVDPEDDMRVTNPPANPELLDALAENFIQSGFDLKHLVRTICQSRTYQLSSEPNDWNESDKQNFSSFYPKRLTAEVLYDAVNQVTGTTAGFGGLPPGTRATQLPDDGFDNYFLSVFGKPKAESACECERSAEANLAQSLHLLNSPEVQGKLTSGSGMAARLATDEERDNAAKVRELTLWVYGRPPQERELELILPHLAGAQDQKRAWEDVLWAMINTKEFLFNH